MKAFTHTLGPFTITRSVPPPNNPSTQGTLWHQRRGRHWKVRCIDMVRVDIGLYRFEMEFVRYQPKLF